MTAKNTDERLVEQLRSMFKEGRSIEDMCTTIWSELEVESGNAMTAVIYFVKTFGLTLADARLIEGSPICGNAAFSVELVESQLRPKMLVFSERKKLP